MKKRLLISSVLMSAVLACALGTGTYAWYSATGEKTVSYSAATPGQIGTVENKYVNGSFAVAAVLGSPSKTVALTDTSGKTHYYVGETLLEDKTVTEAEKYGTISVGITITYDGELTEATDIKAAWEEYAVTSIKVTVEKTGEVKIGSSAELAYKAGEASVVKTFDVADITFTDGVHTSLTQDVYYAVAGANVTSQSANVGTIKATPAKA